MEQTSLKSEFNEESEEKHAIALECSLSEQNIDLTTVKTEEDVKPTVCHQGSEFPNESDLPTINIVDNIQRWTVSSSVIIPVEKTENTCYVSDQPVETVDRSVDRLRLAISVKNEDTSISHAKLCELNEHTSPLEVIHNVILGPSGKQSDSDVLLSSLSSNGHFNSSSTEDSQVKTFSRQVCSTNGKFTLKVGRALCRDPKTEDETPKKKKVNSFYGNSLDSTVSLSTIDKSQSTQMSELSDVVSQSQTPSGKKPFKCQFCDDRFSNISSLTRHQRIHTRKKPYQCDVCHKSFSRSRYLGIHQRIHTDESSYKCDVCDKTFTMSSSLTAHQFTHTGEKPYKCGICNKTYTSSNILNRHLRTHSDEKPYECGICDKTFKQASTLSCHRRIHTGEKPYKCDVCNKTFTQPGTLAYHQRIHTGEKPHKCDICNKEFNRPSNLTSHKRIHTGETPYKCVICDKEFVVSSALKRHIVIHTGEKPYKCVICPREFVQSSSLKRHIRTAHN